MSDCRGSSHLIFFSIFYFFLSFFSYGIPSFLCSFLISIYQSLFFFRSYLFILQSLLHSFLAFIFSIISICNPSMLFPFHLLSYPSFFSSFFASLIFIFFTVHLSFSSLSHFPLYFALHSFFASIFASFTPAFWTLCDRLLIVSDPALLS